MDGPKGPAKLAILCFSSFLLFFNFGPGADFPNSLWTAPFMKFQIGSLFF